MKKGFTLIELLAVIVILSIISLIATPIVINVVDESRKQAFKETCNQIYDSADIYIFNEEILGNSDLCITFDFGKNNKDQVIESETIYEPISKLNLKGELPKSGTYKICNKKRELLIDNGKYTCIKNNEKNEILSGTISENDITPPVLNNITLTSTANSINVVVDATETDGEITKYYYKLDDETKESSTNIYKFTNLESNREYEITVVVENKSGLKSNSISKKITTSVINSPTFEVSKSPEDTEYSTSKILTIKYDTNTDLNNYFKSSVEAKVEQGIVTETCGTGTEPSSCITSNVTTLEANTWYKTNNERASVVYTANGTLYALTVDSNNVTIGSTYEITKIDTTKPTVEIQTSNIKTDRITINAICADKESGITKYEYSKDNGATWIEDKSSHTFTELKSGENYIYKIKCTNGSGLSEEKSISESTSSIENPTIKYTNTPSTAVNGYLTSQTIKVTFIGTGIQNPEYFVKTTRKGTSDVAVTSACGTGTEPSGCTTSNVTTLEANVWYKVSKDVNITYNEHSTSTGTLYALTYDGTNYSVASTGTINKIDTSIPTTEITLTDVKTDRITVNAICTDTETGIIKYEYSKNNGTTWETDSKTSHTFTGLNKEQEYTFKVRCTNGLNKTNTASNSESTLGMTNPTMKESSKVPATGYTWATSRTITVTYTNTGIQNPVYYFKTNVATTVGTGIVTGVCGTGTEPSSCTTSSVTTLTANTWYKTTNTTPSITFAANGTLYALTSDGNNVSGTSTYAVTKVSTGTPTAPTITGGDTNWSTTGKTISVSTASTETSGIKQYQYYLSTSSTTQTGGSWINCSTSQTITTNGEYYVYFRAIANNGKVSKVSNYQLVRISTDSYSSSEINTKISELEVKNDNNVTDINNVTTETNTIDLSKYAKQTELDELNEKVTQVSTLIKSNTDRLSKLES